MKRIKSIGYGICLLFALSLFLSEKFENNVLIPLLLVLFLISISFDKDRENIFVFKEKKISVAVFLLALTPFVIAFWTEDYIQGLIIIILNICLFFH